MVALLASACSQGSSAGPRTSSSPSPISVASPTTRASPSPEPAPVPQRAEASMPAPRQEVAEAVLPGAPDSLVVIGGFDLQGRSSNTVQWLINDTWMQGPAYPVPVDHAAAATAGGRLIVAGGNSNGAARADVYRFDPSSSGWVRVAPMHHARGALTLVADGALIYALGGLAGSEVGAVEVYDTAKDTWTDVTALPQPRDHGAGFAINGNVCLAGGRSPNTARVDCYDPRANSWSRLPDLPTATSGAGAGFVDGRVVVAGGEDAGESRLVDHVFRLAAVDGRWTDEPMLVPRHGIQLAIFNGRAWACGGATAAGYQASAACTSIG